MNIDRGKADYFEGDLCYELGEGVIRHVDMVMGCVDNMQTRIYLSHICKLNEKPYIDTGIENFDWHVFPMSGHMEEPCFACILSAANEQKALDRVRNSCDVTRIEAYNNDEIPTIGVSGASAGALAVQEAIKACHAKSAGNELFPPMFGVFHAFSGQDNTFKKTRIHVRENCSHHISYSAMGGVRETPISARWTLRRTLEWVKAEYGEEYAISLIKDAACVNRGFVTTARCKHCGRMIDVYQPLPLFDTDLLCAECQENHLAPSLLSDSKLKMEFSRFDEEQLQEMTLKELGIPLAHIVEFVPMNPEKDSLFLELTADIPELMPKLSV